MTKRMRKIGSAVERERESYITTDMKDPRGAEYSDPGLNEEDKDVKLREIK